MGDYCLDGDRLFARIQSYVSQPAEQRKFENHRKYIDVQAMLEGRERQDVAPGKDLIPIGTFDDARDIVKLDAPELFAQINLEPGWFVVYFPHDNHRPNCCVYESEQVRKVCIKVKVLQSY